MVVLYGCKFSEKSNNEDEACHLDRAGQFFSRLLSLAGMQRTRLSPPYRREPLFTRGGGHNVVDPRDLPGFVRVRPDGRRLTAV